MSLRKKTLIVIGLTFLVLAVAVYFTLQGTVIRRFNEYEREEVLRDVDRADNALSVDISSLDDFLKDWSNWDDAYSFIQTEDPAFIETNLGDETFRLYDLNLIAFVDLSGRVVYQKSFDSMNNEVTPVPPEVCEHLVPGDRLVSQNGPTEGVGGLLLTCEYPLMIVSRSILTSDAEGPSRGALVMGRYLDPPAVKRLAKTTMLDVEIQAIDEPEKSEDLTRAITAITKGAEKVTGTLTPSAIAGYSLVNDIYGNPAAVLRVTEDRAIHRQGQTFALYLSLALFLVFLISGGVLMALMERVVVSPVARLDSSVSKIGDSADPSVRVDARGNDELSSLGSSINEMLEALENSRTELEASEERYRSIFSLSPDLIFIIEEGRISDANPALVERSGLTLDEVRSRSFMEFVPREDRPGVNEVIERLMRGEEVRGFEVRIGVPGQPVYDYEINAIPLLEGGSLARVLCLARDVTERKRAEQLIHESERRYRLLFDNAGDAIYTYDRNLVLTGVNRRAYELSGYEEGEIIGRNILELGILHPDDMPKVARNIAMLLAGERVIEDEIRFIRKDGTVIIADVTAAVLVGDDGGVEMVTNIARDITDRKRAEEQLRVTNAELEGYAHVVSHDLKSPLTAIMSAADLLEMLLRKGGDTGQLSPHVGEALDVLHKGIDKSSSLITDLLDLAEAGHEPRDVGPVDTSEVVASIIEQMRPVLEERNAQVVVSEDLGSVTASPTHIYQLFANLIANAIKHNDKESPVVRVSYLGEDAGGGHRYVVSDNGPGIPEADMENLFLPFFKGTGGETGIGLSIVEKVINNYSGEVRVYNSNGANFEFTIRDIET